MMRKLRSLVDLLEQFENSNLSLHHRMNHYKQKNEQKINDASRIEVQKSPASYYSKRKYIVLKHS